MSGQGLVRGGPQKFVAASDGDALGGTNGDGANPKTEATNGHDSMRAAANRAHVVTIPSCGHNTPR